MTQTSTTHVQRWNLGACLSFCLIALPFIPTLAQEDTRVNNAAENKDKVAPLVIMENTPLTGRIIFMQEDDMDEEPGRKLDIAILTERRRKPIYETVTDDQGLYSIPQLEAGAYWMQVAQLTLRLRVNALTNAPIGTTNNATPLLPKEKPKILVIFIPRDLG